MLIAKLLDADDTKNHQDTGYAEHGVDDGGGDRHRDPMNMLVKM